MYRQKSVIFTIGKTLYIKTWKDIKERVLYSYIYIENTYYLVYIRHLGQNKEKERGLIYRKIPLYR